LLDVLLTPDGDLFVNEWGDIRLTESVRQAVRVRLLWFLNEWRFAPRNGVPYYEFILTKNPNIERIRRIFKNEIESAEEVREARNIKIVHEKNTRRARVTYEIVISEQTYREEVEIPWGEFSA